LHFNNPEKIQKKRKIREGLNKNRYKAKAKWQKCVKGHEKRQPTEQRYNFNPTDFCCISTGREKMSRKGKKKNKIK